MKPARGRIAVLGTSSKWIALAVRETDSSGNEVPILQHLLHELTEALKPAPSDRLPASERSVGRSLP